MKFTLFLIIGLGTLFALELQKKTFRIVEHNPFSWDSTGPSYAGENQSDLSYPLAEADSSTSVLRLSAFIKSGELWLRDSSSFTQELVTKTGGRIRAFYFSPNRKYLACTKFCGIDTIWADSEDPNYQHFSTDSVYNLVFLNCLKRTAKEIGSDLKTFNFVSWYKWISKSRGLFRVNDQLTVGGCYVYDAYRDTCQNVNYGYWGDDKEK